ncbi:hypothetical protein NHX12_034253 [Muraenolepis orangiensis]|uniref:Protein kinase domain-containing protein n=1 Tax=Muraenolepis orangiensis TaxID=630683 RepID=A0A9Q0D4F2_9TELE|nr:hypothetical protein NHX12_034253 [Muraenolepis orangiensis]
MEVIEPILGVASSIYQLVGEVQANRKRCQRVADRVRVLEELVTAIKGMDATTNSAHVETTLQKLHLTLLLAEDLVRKYTDARVLRRVVLAYHLAEDFGDVNERLNDAHQGLALALQVEHGHALQATGHALQAASHAFHAVERRTQDDTDRRADGEDLMKILREMQDADIREISEEELTYDPAPFMTTPTSEVYKGEYNKFTVAIKRFTSPVTTCPEDMRSVFHQEVETMRHFESPNILRMFGICVQDENGPSPTYLIVMEYCEKGSLRQVLDSPRSLSWSRRALMSLDAARGLYRLHQTEQKSKVHGCINSSKFLVTEGYRVKLGGLELAKTETSLRRRSDGRRSSLRYCSPQQLLSLDHVYNKKCEIYSFGIVLWEIATRRRPLEDCSSRQDVYNKVIQDRVLEKLPDDCPSRLRQLVDLCRAYDDFHRPTAGVLVDKLRRVVDDLEEE